MQNEMLALIEEIVEAIQNQEFDRIENLDLVLKSTDFYKHIENIKSHEAELIYSKIQIAVGIINTQKQLLLDELTLLKNGKKALAIYTS